MVSVRWTDGRRDSAGNYTALLRRVNGLPWNRHMNEQEFRQELARRAYVWSGEAIVHSSSPPAQLFAELAEAGLLTIEK